MNKAKETDGGAPIPLDSPVEASKTKDATKAKRTFLEVVLGDDPMPVGDEKEQEKKKEQEQRDARADSLGKILELIGEDQSMVDYRETLMKDLALAKKPAAKQKARAIQIEAKAAFIEREAKRLSELEKDIQKAQTALVQRTTALEKERAIMAQLRKELLQGTAVDAGADREGDGNLDALERKELELLRELSANFKPDGLAVDAAVTKRVAKDLEDVQRDLETKRRRTSAAATDSGGTNQ